ncbi:cullin family [Phytophthora cinnamomi]|uniref:cullin family n=1 Tax=Phytophthora cinnamomi TaxID=4785 RepID=UPI003559ED59|nr:cullin family [Phytophthora cinnamomi]
MLFFRLRGLLVKHVEAILKELNAIDGEPEFLSHYCASFEAFATGTSYISELFRYLLLRSTFRHDIAFKAQEAAGEGNHPSSMQHDVTEASASDGDCIASTVQTYFSLGLCRQDQMSLYREELEQPFLEDAARYYSAKAMELLSKRCEARLHRTTVIQVRQACCRVLVDEHADQICEDAESFLINNQKEDLHRLSSELTNENALMSFKNILKKYIERSGLEVVQKFQQEDTTKNPEGYIEALVQVRKYFELIKDAFGYHPLMRSALDQVSCPNRITTKPNAYCRMNYFRVHLQEVLLEVLAKRLIKGTSASNDMEILLIQKLREICGCDFVSKLQKMLKDKMLSKELMDSFTAWLEEKDIELRSEDAANTSAIDLHHALYQMLILVQFNTAKEITRSDLVQLTNIPDQECTHHLASLVKAKILTIDGDAANPTYAINFGFSPEITNLGRSEQSSGIPEGGQSSDTRS